MAYIIPTLRYRFSNSMPNNLPLLQDSIFKVSILPVTQKKRRLRRTYISAFSTESIRLVQDYSSGARFSKKNLRKNLGKT